MYTMKDLKFKHHKNFTTPENYFNQLEKSILNETKRFEDGASFDVPENYFSRLETKLISTALPHKKSKWISLWWAAASVAACLLVFVILYSNDTESTPESSPFVMDSKSYEAEVDPEVEEAVYESLYKSYFVDEDIKKSSNEISLDDLDHFYAEKQLSSTR